MKIQFLYLINGKKELNMFWDSIDYNNARKVLVIPNITNSSNIEKDSFIDVIHNHIKGLDKYGEYYWHVNSTKG
jgi:predicted deacetylase